MNPNVTSGLWVMMMCYCRFIDCKKCIALMQMLLMGEAMQVWGAEGTWEISELCVQFSCEPKSALKK